MLYDVDHCPELPEAVNETDSRSDSQRSKPRKDTQDEPEKRIALTPFDYA